MKKSIVLGLLAATFALPVMAELKAGDKAPAFTVPAAFAGKELTYSLTDNLKKGPVVLYFYPAAFTKGCTIEAHMFAEAVPDFASLGASVVGVSSDKIETLAKFSVSECSSKFAVAADTDQKVMKSYDSILLSKTNYASRTSYVISPEGKVIHAFTDMDPALHVEKSMAALKTWKSAQAK